MKKGEILELLAGGDRRGTGRADEVAAMVAKNPKLFPQLIQGLWHEDRVVRMRAADTAEKVTRTVREPLQKYKRELLSLLGETTEQEVRWHLALMTPRLTLHSDERRLVVSTLEGYLKDRSSIVKTFALQGLADLARVDASLQAGVVEALREAARNGTAAMKARSRKLLLEFDRTS